MRFDHDVNHHDLLGAAIRNNASWCAAVCRSHGFPGVLTARLWWNPHHDLELYPQAITLTPDVSASEVAAGHRPAAVKDSFARLDLGPYGLSVLFEAEWIAHTTPALPPLSSDLRWDRVTDAGGLDRWESAWAPGGRGRGPLFRPELLADARCAVLAGHRDGRLVAGVIAYSADGVVGISNLFGTGLPAESLWAGALHAAGRLAPGRPIVGYESGTDLAAAEQAGCRPLGALRVWTA
ncbi:hypothetical protein ACRB68_42290 [Actinomadura sp. RB68]|uniref:Uncharacterized protein n=2 Tax=Actinomadura macrotermitis TaxID=2585200 RepID=A0A7K0BY87_9ACTN|nr:hypothetical protein [Actinomadura macrotermitis]